MNNDGQIFIQSLGCEEAKVVATSKIVLISIFLLFVVMSMTYGHNPVIIKRNSSKENPVLIKKPEISYAYYGELAGEPHYYKIISSKPFTLYVNILVPDYLPNSTPMTKHDMSFQVLKAKGDGSIETAEILCIADGSNYDWHRFYEKYGKDHYYWGPEFEKRVDPGTYYIIVYNSKNVGKYSLAIGKEEKFGFFGIIKAFFRARALDKWFFKP